VTYAEGKGVWADPREAGAWYIKALQFDRANAAVRLGNLYRDGRASAGISRRRGSNTRGLPALY
jgi:TPR repeat protein